MLLRICAIQQHGLWKDAIATNDDLRRAENVVASLQNTPATSPVGNYCFSLIILKSTDLSLEID